MRTCMATAVYAAFSSCDGAGPCLLCHVCLCAGAGLGGGLGVTSQAGLSGGGLKLGGGLGGGLGQTSGLGGGEWVSCAL